MTTQIFEAHPTINANETSTITFAAREKPMDVYDFDFKSFGNQFFDLDIENNRETKNDLLEDKISTKDEDEDLQMLVSMMRTPVKTRKRNSSSLYQKSPFEFEFLNLKRNQIEFYSNKGDNSSCDDHNVDFYSVRKSNVESRQLLEDSIDEAIELKNTSVLSFDADFDRLAMKFRKTAVKGKANLFKKLKSKLLC